MTAYRLGVKCFVCTSRFLYTSSKQRRHVLGNENKIYIDYSVLNKFKKKPFTVNKEKKQKESLAKILGSGTQKQGTPRRMKLAAAQGLALHFFERLAENKTEKRGKLASRVRRPTWRNSRGRAKRKSGNLHTEV